MKSTLSCVYVIVGSLCGANEGGLSCMDVGVGSICGDDEGGESLNFFNEVGCKMATPKGETPK